MPASGSPASPSHHVLKAPGCPAPVASPAPSSVRASQSTTLQAPPQTPPCPAPQPHSSPAPQSTQLKSRNQLSWVSHQAAVNPTSRAAVTLLPSAPHYQTSTGPLNVSQHTFVVPAPTVVASQAEKRSSVALMEPQAVRLSQEDREQLSNILKDVVAAQQIDGLAGQEMVQVQQWHPAGESRQVTSTQTEALLVRPLQVQGAFGAINTMRTSAFVDSNWEAVDSVKNEGPDSGGVGDAPCDSKQNETISCRIDDIKWESLQADPAFRSVLEMASKRPGMLHEFLARVARLENGEAVLQDLKMHSLELAELLKTRTE